MMKAQKEENDTPWNGKSICSGSARRHTSSHKEREREEIAEVRRKIQYKIRRRKKNIFKN